MKPIYILFLREGEFDGTNKGSDLLWDAFSSRERAIKEMRKQFKKGDLEEGKLWNISEVVVDGDNRSCSFYSLDGHSIDDPPTGPKFVLSPAPPRGRCRFVYFCTMKANTPEEIERCRCKKQGRHRDHLTKQGLEFDHNCQENINDFPYVWDQYSKDPKVKKAAVAKLLKMHPEWYEKAHHPK